MKKIILSVLLASVTSVGLVAADNSRAVYKPGVLLPPQPDLIYKKQCASCHGKNGRDMDHVYTDKMPGVEIVIAGMDTDKVVKDLRAYRDLETPYSKYGLGALMKSATADLSWDEIDAVARYVNLLK